ncbi:MAG: HEAT repeat domain-containing protein [Candidatus Omnitrophica bacterium]|nr:HEAT repeat domain-containing protein [Candidatus Omnitrophota bacterium]
MQSILVTMEVNIEAVMLMIERTDEESTWDERKLITFRNKVAHVVRDPLRRQSVLERAGFLQLLDKLATYVCHEPESAYKKIVGLYLEQKLDTSPVFIAKRTLNFFNNRILKDPDFENVIVDLPAWVEYNWRKNYKYFLNLAVTLETEFVKDNKEDGGSQEYEEYDYLSNILKYQQVKQTLLKKAEILKQREELVNFVDAFNLIGRFYVFAFEALSYGIPLNEAPLARHGSLGPCTWQLCLKDIERDYGFKQVLEDADGMIGPERDTALILQIIRIKRIQDRKFNTIPEFIRMLHQEITQKTEVAGCSLKISEPYLNHLSKFMARGITAPLPMKEDRANLVKKIAQDVQDKIGTRIDYARVKKRENEKETVSISIGKRRQPSARILQDGGGAALIREDLGRKRGIIKAYNTKITEELSKAIEEAAGELAKVEIKKAGILDKLSVTRGFLRKNAEWNRNKGKWLDDVIGAQEQILNIAVAKQVGKNPNNYYDNQVALAAENMVKAMLLFFPGYFERVYGNVSGKANVDFYLRLIAAKGDNYAELAINGFEGNGEHLQLLQKSTAIYGSLLRELEKESDNIFEVKVFAQVFLHINKVNKQENNKLFYENISGGEKDGGAWGLPLFSIGFLQKLLKSKNDNEPIDIAIQKERIEKIKEKIVAAASSLNNKRITIGLVLVKGGCGLIKILKEDAKNIVAAVVLGESDALLRDGELAFLIGHEVGHLFLTEDDKKIIGIPIVIKLDKELLMLGSCGIGIGLVLLSFSEVAGLILITLGIVFYGFTLNNFLGLYGEIKADRWGIIFMIKAGYPVEESLNFMRRPSLYGRLLGAKSIRTRNVRDIIAKLNSISQDGGNQNPLGIKDILLSRGFNLQEAEVILEEVRYIVDRLKLKISAKEIEEIVLKFKRFTVWDFIKTNKRMLVMQYLRWFGFALFVRVFIWHKDINILFATVSIILISILYYKAVVDNFRGLSGDLSEGKRKKLADLSRVKILCKSGVHIDLFRETVAHELVHYLGTAGFIKLELYLASAIGEYRIRELNKETEFSRNYKQYYLKGLELADKDGVEFREKEANEFCGIKGFKERSMKIKYIYQFMLDRLDFVGDGWKAYAYGTLISGIAKKISIDELDSQKGWEYLRLRAMIKKDTGDSHDKGNSPIFQDGGAFTPVGQFIAGSTRFTNLFIAKSFLYAGYLAYRVNLEYLKKSGKLTGPPGIRHIAAIFHPFARRANNGYFYFNIPEGEINKILINKFKYSPEIISWFFLQIKFYELSATKKEAQDLQGHYFNLIRLNCFDRRVDTDFNNDGGKQGKKFSSAGIEDIVSIIMVTILRLKSESAEDKQLALDDFEEVLQKFPSSAELFLLAMVRLIRPRKEVIILLKGLPYLPKVEPLDLCITLTEEYKNLLKGLEEYKHIKRSVLALFPCCLRNNPAAFTEDIFKEVCEILDNPFWFFREEAFQVIPYFLQANPKYAGKFLLEKVVKELKDSDQIISKPLEVSAFMHSNSLFEEDRDVNKRRIILKNLQLILTLNPELVKFIEHKGLSPADLGLPQEIENEKLDFGAVALFYRIWARRLTLTQSEWENLSIGGWALLRRILLSEALIETSEETLKLKFYAWFKHLVCLEKLDKILGMHSIGAELHLYPISSSEESTMLSKEAEALAIGIESNELITARQEAKNHIDLRLLPAYPSTFPRLLRFLLKQSAFKKELWFGAHYTIGADLGAQLVVLVLALFYGDERGLWSPDPRRDKADIGFPGIYTYRGITLDLTSGKVTEKTQSNLHLRPALKINKKQLSNGEIFVYSEELFLKDIEAVSWLAYASTAEPESRAGQIFQEFLKSWNQWLSILDPSLIDLVQQAQDNIIEAKIGQRVSDKLDKASLAIYSALYGVETSRMVENHLFVFTQEQKDRAGRYRAYLINIINSTIARIQMAAAPGEALISVEGRELIEVKAIKVADILRDYRWAITLRELNEKHGLAVLALKQVILGSDKQTAEQALKLLWVLDAETAEAIRKVSGADFAEGKDSAIKRKPLDGGAAAKQFVEMLKEMSFILKEGNYESWEIGERIEKIIRDIETSQLMPGEIEDIRSYLNVFAKNIPQINEVVTKHGYSLAEDWEKFVTSAIIRLELSDDIKLSTQKYIHKEMDGSLIEKIAEELSKLLQLSEGEKKIFSWFKAWRYFYFTLEPRVYIEAPGGLLDKLLGRVPFKRKKIFVEYSEEDFPVALFFGTPGYILVGTSWEPHGGLYINLKTGEITSRDPSLQRRQDRKKDRNEETVSRPIGKQGQLSARILNDGGEENLFLAAVIDRIFDLINILGSAWLFYFLLTNLGIRVISIAEFMGLLTVLGMFIIIVNGFLIMRFFTKVVPLILTHFWVIFGSVKESKKRLGSNQETDKETVSESIVIAEQKDNQNSGMTTKQIKALAYWIVMSIAISSILFGPAIMFANVAGYTKLISSSDKLILLFEYILLIVTGIIGIVFAVRGFYRFDKAKMAVAVDKNLNQDGHLGEIENLVSKINEDKADKETKEVLNWESKVEEFILKIPYVILSLALLFGSSYALAFLYGYGLSPWILNAVIFIGGTGVLIGLFYSVENIRALLGQGRAGFSFGLGKEQVKTLKPKERLALIQLADRLYFKNQVQKIQPSFIGAIRNLGTFKGIVLMAAGALIAYSFPGVDNWYILAGAIFGLILPYLVSVTYNFFCSYMNHYKFRSEFVKEYLDNEKAEEELRSKAEQLVSGNKFLFPFKNLWYGFSLRFPVAGSIIIFALARGQMIFWGAVVSSALMPFIGFNTAGISIFEVAMYFFNAIGVLEGFEFSLNLMNIFNDWHLLHTLGDFIRLVIIAYGLSVPFLFNQIIRRPWQSPVFIVSWIFAPLVPYTAKGNFSRFWTSFFHLWIIDFEIGTVLKGAESLSEHPQLDIIGKPMNNVAQSLEGQFGVIRWGSYMLDGVTQITGLDFSQQIHNRLGGKEDVDAWNKAYYLYRTMKFEPALVGKMRVERAELEYLLRLKDFKYDEIRALPFVNFQTGNWIHNVNYEMNSQIRQYAAFLMGDRNIEGAQDTLIQILEEQNEYPLNYNLKKVIVDSLGKVGDYRAAEFLLEKGPAIEALLTIDDPRATDIFITGLKSDRGIVRMASALWLGESENPTAAPALIEALGKEKEYSYEPRPSFKSIEDLFKQGYENNDPVFAEAIALVQINDPNSIKWLIEIANNEQGVFKQRAAAIGALGLLGDPQAIKLLIGLLKSPDTDIRKLSILSLGNFATPEVKNVLYSISYGWQGWVDIKNQEVAASVLEKMKKDKTAESLIKVQDNSISTESLLRNLKNADLQIRYTAFNSLTDRVNEPMVKDAFINLIKYNNDPFMRKQALLSVAAMNDAEARAALKFALNDPHPQVKSAAILSVASWADSKTMEKIKPFLDDPNLDVSRAAALSIGVRLPDFPKNIDYLLPKLNSDKWQVRQAALYTLGENINKFPQLKEPFLKIAKDNTQPFIFQQSALASLSQINEPEIKDLLVSKLNHPDWRMRQTSAFGLGNFKDTDIIPSLKPLLDDKQWQVRQATVGSLGNFNNPQTIDYLIPKLKDPAWQVRQATILPLASNLKAFPRLEQPLMNTFQDKSENLWVRQIAGTSLKNAGYSVGFDLEGIKPLGKSMVIFMSGLDNPNPFDTGRLPGEDWLKNDKIGQDFYKLEKLGLVEIDKSDWSGNIQDMGKAGRDFSKKMDIDYSKARNSKMDSVTFIGISAGGLYSDEGINHFKTLDDEYLKFHTSEERIKINILVGGSPLVQNDEIFYKIAKSTGGQYKPVWSPFPSDFYLSWPVVFKPNSQMILTSHKDYFNNLEFEQLGLSMYAGRDIPITYSRTVSGSFSDQYFSATYKIQQINKVYSSGVTRYQTKEWYTYRSGQELIPSNLYNTINPLPPMRTNLPSMPRVPSGGGIGGGAGIGRGRI